MEWPSRNVSQGGVFHRAKVNYSPETKNFLKLLTEESKLTTMQRNKVNYFLRNGEEMRTPKSEHNFEKSRFPKVTIRPGSSRRRSIDSILQSGAYEREKFVPLHPAVNREQAIKHLQNVLAYDKNARASPKTSRRQKKKNKEEKQTEDINRFDELVNEIKEREEWLHEMEDLGEGHKYKLLIQQQIEARVREMEKLKIAPDSPKSNTKRSVKQK